MTKGDLVVKDDKIILEWDEAAEPWANLLREGKDYSRVEFLNPATFRIIANIRGKQVLDLACGEGYNKNSGRKKVPS